MVLMAGYTPLYIKGMETGLVQNRQEFILPDDAYPVLENFFLFREQLRRRQGLEFLGRLQRNFESFQIFDTTAGTYTFNALDITAFVLTADNANPGLVTTTSPHYLQTGDVVIISNVVGATGYNGTAFTITVVNATSFTIGADATAFGVYVSGGFIYSNRSRLTLTPAPTEPNAEIVPGSVVVTLPGPIVFTDQGNGTLTSPTMGNSGTINYVSGVVVLTHTAGAGAIALLVMSYFPGLPVMGICTREVNSINNEETVFFDTRYAYEISNLGVFEEWIPGTAWTGTDFNFFWSTNYWVNSSNIKLFWVTNFSGTTGDPIRYSDGITWTDFAPTINAAGDVLAQCLALIPFRGRLLAFNTIEGQTLATGVNFFQRIRWAAIGNPIPNPAAVPPYQPWRDDIRGQGGFLDIPTSEDITAIGFVRDNLVIYCERSTWQLRYTGRSIAPFQIEKVNTELGADSTFSAVQFDTTLVGIGDKGVVECDSYKSQRIDIKIPDLVFFFDNDNNGPIRVHGIRDQQQRLAYWIYPFHPGEATTEVYPNRRLVYNYENDSWAIFTDSLTALGTFQPQESIAWQDLDGPNDTWEQANYPWVNRPSQFPAIVGGNQQGFVMYLGSNIEPQVSNEKSLSITDITGNDANPTVITSPHHNLETGQVVSISEISVGTPFANTLNNPLIGIITAATQANPCQITSPLHGLSTGDEIEIDNVSGMIELNGNVYIITVIDANNFTLNVDSTLFTPYISGGNWIDEAINAFGIVVLDENRFQLWVYSPITMQFSIPQMDVSGQVYIGGGKISVRDGFTVQSKKFNFLDEGSNIQIGYLDVLMSSTDEGAITLNVFSNYNDDSPVNLEPQNNIQATSLPDTFFNSNVPTSQTTLGGLEGLKYWQRVFCPTNAAFITIQWTLSNAQLVGVEQESDVQIDSQILWMRKSGRLQTF